MEILIILVVGLVAGVAATSFTKSNLSYAGSTVVGILGAFVGSWVISFFNIPFITGIWGSILSALLGALIILGFLKIIKQA